MYIDELLLNLRNRWEIIIELTPRWHLVFIYNLILLNSLNFHNYLKKETSGLHFCEEKPKGILAYLYIVVCVSEIYPSSSLLNCKINSRTYPYRFWLGNLAHVSIVSLPAMPEWPGTQTSRTCRPFWLEECKDSLILKIIEFFNLLRKRFSLVAKRQFSESAKITVGTKLWDRAKRMASSIAIASQENKDVSGGHLNCKMILN